MRASLSHVWLRLVLPWLLAVTVVGSFLYIFPFIPNDGDGRLYAKIAEEVASRDLRELLQVGWYDECRIYSRERCVFFSEHPPGLFVLPVLLTKIGLPAAQAALFADLLYQLGLYLMLFFFVRHFSDDRLAALTLVGVLFMPVSMMYSLRVTQETPLLLSLLICLFAAVNMPRNPLLSLLTLFFGGALAAMMKGLMAVPLVCLCFLGCLWFENNRAPRFKFANVVTAIQVSAAMLLGGTITLALYEQAHLALTGHSFWRDYVDIQIWHRAIEPVSRAQFASQTAAHLTFYLACLIWYASPWSLVVLQSLILKKKGHDASDRNPIVSPKLGSLCRVLFFGSLFLIVLMSPFARVSLRYIYPAYFMLGICGIIVALTKIESKPWFVMQTSWTRIASLSAALWCLTRVGIVLSESPPEGFLEWLAHETKTNTLSAEDASLP